MATFLSSGCCVIPNVLPSDYVRAAHTKVTKDRQWLLDVQLPACRNHAVATQNEHLHAAVLRRDFRELVARDGQRQDVRFQLDRFPFVSPGLVYNPIVYPLVQALLGVDHSIDCNDNVQQQQQQQGINLLYAGVMWAMPVNDSNDEDKQDDCDHQKWHADGGHLFPHVQLPPHCINVFYPLVDLTEENGPTQVKPGSHIRRRRRDENENQDEPPAVISLKVDAGGVCLFDYRLQHRGAANRSNQPRPILYLAYAKTFFRDAGNTRSNRSIVMDPAVSSPPWVARILIGQPPRMGQGFDTTTVAGALDYEPTTSSSSSHHHSEDAQQRQQQEPPVGSGERWVLFQMKVELDNDRSEAVFVHHGDVPTEVAAQFCQTQSLDAAFVPVLAELLTCK